MLIEDFEVKNIYDHMQDIVSKEIFMDRLNYSLTQDICFLEKMINRTLRKKKGWNTFYQTLQQLKNEKLIIFGAGIWGNILYRETFARVDWEKVIDNHPNEKRLADLPVISVKDFIGSYSGEYVVISSYKNSQMMISQLLEGGIPLEKIINAGKVIFELTEKAIYFDLEALLPQKEEEYFVDAGCFDGLTTKQFFKWCQGKGYSYCFEPDEINIERIQNNLQGNSRDYEIIRGAVWSKNGMLTLESKGNFASSVSEEKCMSGSFVEAVSLDAYLKGKTVTFIKMDIEGAEMEALKGAANIIKEQRPRLAVSIYHKREDIWKIPLVILELCPDYNFYLRHYSFGNYDTVLYAVCDDK